MKMDLYWKTAMKIWSVTSTFKKIGFPVDWMRLFRGFIIFFVNLNCFVSFSSNKPGTTLVKWQSKNSSFTVHGTRLDWSLSPLEVVTGFPIPEVKASIICSRNQNIVLIDSQTINDGIVARQVLNKIAIRALPLFYIVWRSRCKHVPREKKETLGKMDISSMWHNLQGRMIHNCSNTLLVISEGGHGSSCSQIPQSNSAVMTAGDDLRFSCLTHNRSHCICVPT